ncbi:hypothetical protein CK627_20870 [Aeromonas dhakensis]|uniref:hypothetical protein n=1 Tax=Aeromonas dhakensis TaxID=196024 RepID=UPI000BAB15B7|nr:hypothetical protein [Aeromonas dhakensis]ASX13062.1 hypothetical protein CK627_20870 [Aeromonas dhakensis]
MLFYTMRRTVRGVFSLTSTWLTVSVVLCVVIVAINALVWDHMLEPFNGAAALASAGVDLLLAYVAGYIFYVLTSVYPEYKKLQAIYFAVMQTELIDVAHEYADLLGDLVLQGEHIDALTAFETYGSKKGQSLLVQATKDINMLDEVPNQISTTWLEYLTKVNTSEQHSIEKMLRFDMEIELEIKVLLTNLLHSPYTQTLNHMNSKSNAEKMKTIPFKTIVYRLHMHLSLWLKLQNHIMSTLTGNRL